MTSSALRVTMQRTCRRCTAGAATYSEKRRSRSSAASSRSRSSKVAWWPWNASSARLHERLAANQARQLTQARHHALPRQRFETSLEAQHQAAVLDQHRRLRQHARRRGRDEIGHPQRSAEHARTIKHAGGSKLAQPRRELVVDQAHVPKEYRQRNESAAGVVDGYE